MNKIASFLSVFAIVISLGSLFGILVRDTSRVCVLDPTASYRQPMDEDDGDPLDAAPQVASVDI